MKSYGEVHLVDQAGAPRTPVTLVASLAARYAVLHYVSGADVIGSLTAGFASLGREVSHTSDGARLRKALEYGRPGMNGTTLWSALHIGEWASTLPPAPVLDQLRNDVALLLDDNLNAALDMLPISQQANRAASPEKFEAATFIDCLLGLWAFSIELTRAVEALAKPTLLKPGSVAPTNAITQEQDNSLLR